MKHRTTPIAWRIAADTTLALASLAAGLGLRLFVKGGHFEAEFLQFFRSYALLLAASVVLTFAVFRIYTRNRLYVRRQKLLSITQATFLAYVIFFGRRVPV